MVSRQARAGAEFDAAALEAALPRILIAEGLAAPLARVWADRVREDLEAGRIGVPRFPFSKSVAHALFESRRARQLVRGLESATEALDRQAAGLAHSAATRPTAPGGRRISRMLVIANDGASRFERDAAGLRVRHADRLELIGVAADEIALGEAVFGPGRRARAVLLDHKEAVVRVLDAILAEA